MYVRVSLDKYSYKTKPNKFEASQISNRVGNGPTQLSINELANTVGNNGFSWCPVTFKNGERKNENFLMQQVFALDFDKGITFNEVQDRALEYGLNIAFAYETFSSVNLNVDLLLKVS